MKITLILSIILMAALVLMLYAAVALIQSKKLFGSAPKDIQAAITEHKEWFPGARLLGWKLLIIDKPFPSVLYCTLQQRIGKYCLITNRLSRKRH